MNQEKKIAIIGPGAMGMLFGGYFSKCFDVTLIGRNPKKMELIAREGLTIKEMMGQKIQIIQRQLLILMGWSLWIW